eukprot:GHUV01017680.1.p1 GENE.GHUV01017680.1~~GHUV01017680.1.p1  ORF type:complete len:770 (+),score=236.02 GHUV01017680.1:1915-4224(+)
MATLSSSCSRFNCPSSSLVVTGCRRSSQCKSQSRQRQLAQPSALRPADRRAHAFRQVGSREQQIARAGKAAETARFANWQNERVYKIPIINGLAADKVAQAQKAAEAEHQTLMTTGPIAEAMRTNSFLRSVVGQYSILQKLYHKAVLPVLQQHGELAASGFSLAYAIYCQLLQRTPGKRPGDSISSAELELLAAEVQQLPPSMIDHKLTAFAYELSQLSERWSSKVVDLFRLRDLISLMGDGPMDLEDAVDEVAEAFGIEGAFKGLASMAATGVLRSGRQWHMLKAQRCLLAMCQPSSTPPDTTVDIASFARSLGLSMVNMGDPTSVMCAALQLLPSSDQAAVLQLEAELCNWIEIAHSSPICTTSSIMPAGSIPINLMTLCMFTQYGEAMCAAAFEQLRGDAPLHDWSTAHMVLTTSFAELPSEAFESWLNVQRHLLSLAQGKEVPKDQLVSRVMSTVEATNAGHLLHFGSDYVRIELARMSPFGCLAKSFAAESRGGQAPFLDMLLQGLLQVIDRNSGCWSSAMYWIDIVQLALQEAGGTPGPAAVAAGERLIREKHSLFMARLALRLLQMHNPAFAVQHAKGTSLLVYTPPSIGNDVNTMILARGDPKRAAKIAAYQQSGRLSGDQGLLDVLAGGPLAAAATTTSDGSMSSSLQQDMLAMLTSSGTPPQHLNNLFKQLAAAGTFNDDATSQSPSVCDPHLVDAYAAWLYVRSTGELSISRLSAVADKLWFPAALAQWWIYENSSSKAVAQQLLGSGALEEHHVRSG